MTFFIDSTVSEKDRPDCIATLRICRKCDAGHMSRSALDYSRRHDRHRWNIANRHLGLGVQPLDNDQAGYAADDALHLRPMLEGD